MVATKSIDRCLFILNIKDYKLLTQITEIKPCSIFLSALVYSGVT